ncbi:MAG: SpoIIE family protein phosphatase [bacterium]
MRRLEKTGPILLGLVIISVFGLFLPESDRIGITYLAALLLGLVAGLEGFRALKSKSFSLQMGIATGGVLFPVFLFHLTHELFLGGGTAAQTARHGAIFALSGFFFWFFLVLLPPLRKLYRGWQRTLFYGACGLLALAVLATGTKESIIFFWCVFFLFGIRWSLLQSLSPTLLAILIFIAALAGSTPFLGGGVGAETFVPSVLSLKGVLLAGRVAGGLFEVLRIGVRIFCIFFAIFGAYHWTAVLLFGSGRVRAKLLGIYFLTALVPLLLFATLVFFGLYLIVASYRSALTKNLFLEEQTRFHRWVAAISARPSFWESLRQVEGGARRLPLSLLDLYPKALFDVLRQVEMPSDSLRVYAVVGGEDTVRLPKELFEGGTVMGACGHELCLNALLPTTGFVLRGWIPITRDFLQQLKDITGTDITVYPTSAAEAELQVDVPRGMGFRLSFAEEDSTAGFERISTREPHRKRSWLDAEFVAGINTLQGVDWPTGAMIQYPYILRLSPSQLWQTVFNPREPINLGMRAAFYFLAVVFLGGMVAISLFGWRVAGGINRSARSLEKGVQELRTGHLDYVMPMTGGTEFRQVAESFNLLTSDIRRMLRDLAEKERLDSELALARAIQEALLPTALPRLPGIAMAARSLPSRVVGGDYYDLIPLPDGNLLIAVGDVSGKGIAAALVTAKVQASLHSLAGTFSSLPQLMDKLNQATYRGAAPGMFASLFLARLDPQNARLDYVNGGHDFPILCRDGQVEFLKEGGLILGVFPEATYCQGTVEGLQHSRLLLYTDGLVETRNRREREFGVDALAEIIKTRQGCAEDLLDCLFSEVEGYSEGEPAEDDRTAMLLVF